jgi:hypothetical protein
MELTPLIQGLAVSYASGVSTYATVALLGLARRAEWIGPLPGALGFVSEWWMIGPALLFFAFELAALVIPGAATLWETVHAAIRPPAAAALAVATAWGGSPALVAGAALLGGGLAFTTSAAKLGVRAAVDTSPEPVSNTAFTAAELGVVASVAYFVWEHPILTLVGALLLLLLTILLVRAAWRAIKRVFTRGGDEVPA